MTVPARAAPSEHTSRIAKIVRFAAVLIPLLIAIGLEASDFRNPELTWWFWTLAAALGLFVWGYVPLRQRIHVVRRPGVLALTWGNWPEADAPQASHGLDISLAAPPDPSHEWFLDWPHIAVTNIGPVNVRASLRFQGYAPSAYVVQEGRLLWDPDAAEEVVIAPGEVRTARVMVRSREPGHRNLGRKSRGAGFDLQHGRLYVCDDGFEQDAPALLSSDVYVLVITAVWGETGSVSRYLDFYVPADPRKPLWFSLRSERPRRLTARGTQR